MGLKRKPPYVDTGSGDHSDGVGDDDLQIFGNASTGFEFDESRFDGLSDTDLQVRSIVYCDTQGARNTQRTVRELGEHKVVRGAMDRHWKKEHTDAASF